MLSFSSGLVTNYLMVKPELMEFWPWVKPSHVGSSVAAPFLLVMAAHSMYILRHINVSCRSQAWYKKQGLNDKIDICYMLRKCCALIQHGIRVQQDVHGHEYCPIMKKCSVIHAAWTKHLWSEYILLKRNSGAVVMAVEINLQKYFHKKCYNCSNTKKRYGLWDNNNPRLQG